MYSDSPIKSGNNIRTANPSDMPGQENYTHKVATHRLLADMRQRESKQAE